MSGMLLDGRLRPGQRVTVATDDGAGLAFRVSDGESASAAAQQGTGTDQGG